MARQNVDRKPRRYGKSERHVNNTIFSTMERKPEVQEVNRPDRRRPFEKIKIGNLEIKMLVDSGSNITIISERDFNLLSPCLRPVKLEGGSVAKSASGGNLHLTGLYRLPISCQNKVTLFPVHVCQEVKGYGVLGIDFLKYAKMILDTETNTIYYKDRKHNLNRPEVADIITRGDIHIPAGSIQKVKLRTNMTAGTRLAGQVLGIATIASNKSTPNLQADDAMMYTDQEGNITTLLYNVGVHEIHLPRGANMGKFHTLNKRDSVKTLDDILDKLPYEKAPPINNTMRCSKDKREYLIKNSNLSHLPETLRRAYLSLIMNNHDIFSLNDTEIGSTQTVMHKLHLKDPNPVYRKQFPVSDAHLEQLNIIVDDWLKAGVIRPCHSEWNSAIFLVPKKLANGQIGYRAVIDYRSLNSQCLTSNYRIPEIGECISGLGKIKPKLFTTLDLRAGYNQMSIHPSSQELTAFTLPGKGQFCFQRCSFGLKNMPIAFSRLMSIVFRNFNSPNLIYYLDDMLAAETSHENMLTLLQRIFNRLRAHNLMLNISKCSFSLEQTGFLGWTIGKDGYRPMNSKVEAILKARDPQSLKEVRSFVGTLQFLRNTIPKFSKLVQPLTALTKKESNWNGGPLPEKAQKAVKALKLALTKAPTLAYPTRHGDYSLFVDASQGTLEINGKKSKLLEPGGLGAVLTQEQEGKIRVIAYASRNLDKHEENYSPFLLEVLAMSWAVDHFRTTLLGHKFKIFSDHKPGTNLYKAVHTKTLTRLQEQTMEYDFTVHYFPGNVQPADYLSRYAYRDEAKIENGEFHNGLYKYIHDKGPIYVQGKRVDEISDGGNSAERANIISGLVNNERYIYELTKNAQPLLSMKYDSISKLQSEDEVCKILITFVKTGVIPPNGLASRICKQYGRQCRLKDNLLIYLLQRVNKPDKATVFCPAVLHAEIIAQAHGKWYTGHVGRFKTVERIKEEYFWPGMDDQVSQFIETCNGCQFANDEKLKRAIPPLGPDSVTVNTAPFDVVGMDLFGPLQDLEGGKGYVLVLVDAATRWTEFLPLENKQPETVAFALVYNFFSTFGLCKQLLSDNGKEFNASLMAELCKLLQISQHFNSPYVSQTGGLFESRMKVLRKYLQSMLDNTEKTHWREVLPLLKLSWNSSVSKATKQSPYMLLFGRHAKTPSFDPNDIDRLYYGDDFVSGLKNRLNEARRVAREANLEFRQKYKDSHDRKILTQTKSQQPLKEGNLVLLHRPELAKINRKITTQYDGPYVILSLWSHNALIQNLESGVTKYVHNARIKRYHQGQDELLLRTDKHKHAVTASSGFLRSRDALPDAAEQGLGLAPPHATTFDENELDIQWLGSFTGHRPIKIKTEDSSSPTVPPEIDRRKIVPPETDRKETGKQAEMQRGAATKTQLSLPIRAGLAAGAMAAGFKDTSKDLGHFITGGSPKLKTKPSASFASTSPRFGETSGTLTRHQAKATGVKPTKQPWVLDKPLESKRGKTRQSDK